MHTDESSNAEQQLHPAGHKSTLVNNAIWLPHIVSCVKHGGTQNSIFNFVPVAEINMNFKM